MHPEHRHSYLRRFGLVSLETLINPSLCGSYTNNRYSNSVIFVGTTYMSFNNLMQYRRTGTMPYDGSDPTFAAHSQAAFSSNTAHDFDEEDAEFRTGRPADNRHPSSSLGGRNDDDEYALLQHSELEDSGPQGGRPPPSYDPAASHMSSMSPPPHGPIPVVPAGTIPAGSTLHDYDTSYGGAYGHQTHPSGSYEYNNRY